MRDYHFITESSNAEKLRSFIITAIVILIFIAVGVLYITIWSGYFPDAPLINAAIDSIKQDIASLNLQGVFYAHFVGGIFFVPSPDEAIFYYALAKGNSMPLAFIFAVGGYLLAQVANYFLGYKMSNYIHNIVSKRKIYKARRFANKYGVYGIFLLNVTPSPDPLLTLSLGLTKYNFARLMFWTTLGKSIKYIIVILIFVAIN